MLTWKKKLNACTLKSNENNSACILQSLIHQRNSQFNATTQLMTHIAYFSKII
jgi:hypothetical protein